jgi:transposase
MLDHDRESLSALKESRKSARSERIELITRGERRRSWSIEQKREIAAESFVPGTVAAMVARKHGIGTGQLYTWRKQFLDGAFGEVTRVAPSFLRVDVNDGAAAARDGASKSVPADASSGTPAPAPAPDPIRALLRRGALIEIILRGEVSIWVDSHVDEVALRRVLSSLERR